MNSLERLRLAASVHAVTLHELNAARPFKDDSPEHWEALQGRWAVAERELEEATKAYAEDVGDGDDDSDDDDSDDDVDPANNYNEDHDDDDHVEPQGDSEKGISDTGTSVVLDPSQDDPAVVVVGDSDEKLDAAVLKLTDTLCLPEHFVKGRLKEKSGTLLKAAYPLALAALNGGANLEEQARTVLRTVALDFVHNEEQSIFDLLKPSVWKEFKDIDWDDHDHIWSRGTKGPNREKFKKLVQKVLPKLRAQRMPNGMRPTESGALVLKAKSPNWDDRRHEWSAFFEELCEHVGPKNTNYVNKWAAESLTAMQEEAKEDGLKKLHADYGTRCTFRSEAKEDARRVKKEERSGKKRRKSYSNHQMGLAIDFRLHANGAVSGYEEVTYKTCSTKTRSCMSGYYSPVAKWLCVFGESHGWYPLWPEPWHWQYVPPGLTKKLKDEAESLAPELVLHFPE